MPIRGFIHAPTRGSGRTNNASLRRSNNLSRIYLMRARKPAKMHSIRVPEFGCGHPLILTEGDSDGCGRSNFEVADATAPNRQHVDGVALR
jgi:hypothetical protein